MVDDFPSPVVFAAVVLMVVLVGTLTLVAVFAPRSVTECALACDPHPVEVVGGQCYCRTDLVRP